MWTACSSSAIHQTERPNSDFNADSAYKYVAHQVQFGPRVPDSEAHSLCGNWLVAQMQQFGGNVQEQVGWMPNYKGERQRIQNIQVHIDGSVPTRDRILLCAHWDSRPWSDEEDDYAHRFQPVPGANDGASGVGVLMEVVRQLCLLRQSDSLLVDFPNVDVVLFDAEDMGAPSHYVGDEKPDTWCLGSQLWANTYRELDPSEKPHYRYGILLDMVGDPSATFVEEYYSLQYAANYQEKMWRIAASLGYGNYFVRQKAYPIIDDHYYINTIAHIPCVDVIDYKVNSGFPHWWHTQQDGMQNIHKQTLKAVGETVIKMICSK